MLLRALQVVIDMHRKAWRGIQRRKALRWTGPILTSILDSLQPVPVSAIVNHRQMLITRSDGVKLMRYDEGRRVRAPREHDAVLRERPRPVSRVRSLRSPVEGHRDVAEPEERGDGPALDPGQTETATRFVMPDQVGDEYAAVHPRARDTARRGHGSAVLKAFQAIATCADALAGVINHEGVSSISGAGSGVAAIGPSPGGSFRATEPGAIGDGLARAGRMDDRRGPDERPGAGFRQMKTCHGKRIRCLASWAAERSRPSENDVYEAHRGRARLPRQQNTVDVLEIFSGRSIISMRANHWGLTAMQPYDIIFGQDLRVREQRRAVMETICKYKPRPAVIQFPCAVWSVLRNCMRREDPSILEGLRQADRPFLTLTRDIFNEQTSRGDHAMAENPSTAARLPGRRHPSWSFDSAFRETTSNMCMFGMVGKGGEPLFKLVRWVATHPRLIAAMDRHCDHMHAHEPMASGNTKTSAAYPQGVADAIILGALGDIADDEDQDYGSSCLGTEVHEVYYTYTWSRSWTSSAGTPSWTAPGDPGPQDTNAIFVEEGTGLWKQVADLVPWQLLSIQLAYFRRPSERARNSATPCTAAR